MRKGELRRAEILRVAEELFYEKGYESTTMNDILHALGLSKRQTMGDIILPQTMKAILPPVVNETITLVKDTALASSLPVIELMKATNSAVNRMTDMTPFFFAAIIYLIMTFVLTVVAGRLEKHFSRYDAKEDW